MPHAWCDDYVVNTEGARVIRESYLRIAMSCSLEFEQWRSLCPSVPDAAHGCPIPQAEPAAV